MRPPVLIETVGGKTVRVTRLAIVMLRKDIPIASRKELEKKSRSPK